MLKKLICVTMALIVCGALLTSCSGKQDTSRTAIGTLKDGSAITIDVDITEKMYVTYINDIYTNCQDYVGKVIRLEGLFKEDYFEETGATYDFVYRTGPGCCGNDGSMCGFEFVADGEMPKDGDWIRVTGTFEGYEENGNTYYHLARSTIEYPEQAGEMTVQN